MEKTKLFKLLKTMPVSGVVPSLLCLAAAQLRSSPSLISPPPLSHHFSERMYPSLPHGRYVRRPRLMAPSVIIPSSAEPCRPSTLSGATLGSSSTKLSSILRCTFSPPKVLSPPLDPSVPITRLSAPCQSSRRSLVRSSQRPRRPSTRTSTSLDLGFLSQRLERIIL